MVSVLTGAALAASVNVSPGDDLTAVTSSLQPGDVVLFNAGTYALEEPVRWTGVGSESAPIEFRAADGAEVILQNNAWGYTAEITESSYIHMTNLIFEGGGDIEYNQPSGLLVYESSHIRIENCTFRNVWGTALRIDGNGSGLFVSHNVMMGTGDGSGIYVGCWDASCWLQDSTIDGNLLHDLEGTGIQLLPGTQGVTVSNNVIYRVDDQGIIAMSTAFGPQNVIRGNAIWQAEDDGIYLSGAALVQNNLIFEILDDGIETSADYGSYDGLYDLQISHNTIVNTEGWGAVLYDWYDLDGMVFANNAISNPTGYGLHWDDWRDDYYDYYGYGDPGPETANYLSNNVVTGLVDGFDPLLRPGFVLAGGGVLDFEDVENYDFYPRTGSRLVDAGDPNGAAYIPSDDFNGTLRDGSSPTVGAYEYDAPGNPGWVVQEGFKEFGAGARTASDFSSGCCGGRDETTGTQALPFLPLLGLGWLKRRR